MTGLKRLKALHWNIQQAAGYKGDEIPAIVFKEITKITPDIGCITEYSKDADNRREFEKYIEEQGYNTFCTQAPKGQNDVLIFVSKKYGSSAAMEFIWNDRNEFPNYLEVLVEGEGFALTVVGTRIRVLCDNNRKRIEEDRKFRLAQMENLNKRLNKIKTPTVVLGDFNGREKWMYQNITATDFHVCKSNGDTYNFDGFSVVIDHAVVRGVKAKVHTSWSFMESLPDIYKDGPFSSNVPSPYPDHAQLICDIAIIEQKRKTDAVLNSETLFDWKKLNATLKPTEDYLQMVMDEMPQGSTSHLKAKQRIESDLNITEGRGCTYPYVIRCVANALCSLGVN